ncbi:jerky protein homolog-like [Osmia bicornis bicornis]|uniref:jerky protein homolog-like n=1 Tax=Osmia bicornis bicornis TaxID=1437191 RepID=UPI001EAF0A93|nr:jerky protein homolog-like [Osmia bicornis bicornis]
MSAGSSQCESCIFLKELVAHYKKEIKEVKKKTEGEEALTNALVQLQQQLQLVQEQQASLHQQFILHQQQQQQQQPQQQQRPQPQPQQHQPQQQPQDSDIPKRKRARELKDSMGLPLDFKVSRGWLDGFKKRHNIALVKVYGESASADEDDAIRFCNDFIKLLEEDDSINIDNIYNMDEAGLLWKALPSKTLIERKEKVVKGYKSRKERITVALCANASGTHKLMPLVINKFENPRALKHCKSNLPLIFKSQKNAWMTQVLFRDWFENYFKPSVRAYQLNKGVTGKVILLLDNCAGHTVPPELLNADNFKIMYLPPNTTSLIQPMDQGIIAKLKCLYRHKTLRKTITYQCGISEFQKQFTLKDCIEILHESWSEVSANNIINSWKKIIPSQEDWYQRAMREDISSFTGDTYSHRDITEFLSICEQEERRTHTDEGDEEMQEDEEIQENVEEQMNKQEERQRLYERLEQDLSQEAPFLQKFFKVIKDQVLGTDD